MSTRSRQAAMSLVRQANEANVVGNGTVNFTRFQISFHNTVHQRCVDCRHVCLGMHICKNSGDQQTDAGGLFTKIHRHGPPVLQKAQFGQVITTCELHDIALHPLLATLIPSSLVLIVQYYSRHLSTIHCIALIEILVPSLPQYWSARVAI